MAIKWDETRIATLTQMWSAGYSAGQIAKQMGDLSRSAVIGKIWRMGLERRREASRYKPVQVKLPKPRPEPLKFAPQPLPRFTEPTVTPPLKSLLDLEPGDCRYPIGDPRESGFGFCAKPRLSGSVYCAECTDKAYRSVRAFKKQKEAERAEAA
jgi:GcrA cell cycle regulator